METNMRVKCDRSSVMKRAWEMKKGRNGWAYTFAQCLKYAWKEEKRLIRQFMYQYEYQTMAIYKKDIA